MAKSPNFAVVTFALLACIAPFVCGQPLGPRPLLPIVEHPSPRVTGNSFLALWRMEDIGAGPENTAIAQHPLTGFMYVGNSQGVLEFDGARWRVLPLPQSDAVLSIAIDSRGRVWAAGESEIARLDPDANGVLRAVTVVHPLPEGEHGNLEQAFAAGDAVWFRGLQNILRIAPDGKIDAWRTGERFGPLWWMDGAVHTKVSDREIARLEGGGRLETVIRRSELRIPAARSSPFHIFAARDVGDGEWILLTAHGPVRWRRSTHTWRGLLMKPPMFRESDAVAATFLDDGAMVFVTTRPGGVVVTPDGFIERMLDRFPSVMNPRVAQLTPDREGGLWVTSREYIARLQVRSAFARHEGPQGLQGNPRQVLRYADQLYVAHSAGVSRYLDWPGNFAPAESLNRSAEVLSVVDDRLYAAATGLVEVVDGGNGTRPWSNLAITTLSGVRGSPNLLLAGDARGVWGVRQENGAWKPEGRLQGLPGGVASIFDAGDGFVWGALADGRIWRADFRAGVRFDAPVAIYGPAEGVPAPARGNRIQFFPLGHATVATCAGWMLRHETATDRFVPETRIAGINSPAQVGAEAVGVNPDGSRWLRMGFPDRRLLRVNASDSDQWRSDEFPAPMIRHLSVVSLYEDRRTLWVAGKDLLTSIDLDWRPARPPAELVARIRNVVSADGQPLWRGDAANPAAKPSLPPGESLLRFEFSAASFVTDHRGKSCVLYRTQLAGFDRDWTAWSAEPWRDFARLPAGDYVFRVQATDQAGRTSAAAAFSFMLPAPWWRTPWAWTGYFAGGGLFLLGVITTRTRNLRRQAAQLEATVAARTEELRRSNAELARLHRLELDEKAAARLAEEEARLEVLRYQLNPHFLYNALNSIYSLVLTTPPAAANMVLRLADFCRVALDRRHEEHTTVGAEFDKLANYLEIEKVRWGDSLHIAVEADEAARRATLPPFLLLPLVENAMKYGGATSPEELSVRVTARLEPAGMLVMSVANTGRWVEQTNGATPTSSGIGLTNLRQRLQRYHPNAHEVSIREEAGWVTVTLKLPSSSP